MPLPTKNKIVEVVLRDDLLNEYQSNAWLRPPDRPTRHLKLKVTNGTRQRNLAI
jgi:hypothetical protein